MKVTFPLSLKISLWLLLNFVLLGAAGVAALVSQGGFGWAALIRGPAGERLMLLTQSVMAEVGAADPAQRTLTLASFGERYGATFYLFDHGGRALGGHPVDLPSPVLERLRFAPPPRGGPRPAFEPGPDLGPGPGPDERPRPPVGPP